MQTEHIEPGQQVRAQRGAMSMRYSNFPVYNSQDQLDYMAALDMEGPGEWPLEWQVDVRRTLRALLRMPSSMAAW
jgi:hypothetical protein